jgi:hypothetical protein
MNKYDADAEPDFAIVSLRALFAFSEERDIARIADS